LYESLVAGLAALPAGKKDSEMATTEQDVVRHWSHGSLERAILDGLAAMGRDLDHVQPEDLAAVDELHMGGHEATVHLAEQMGLGPGMSLLDIGSGLGGPARFFARQYGCAVVGIDLTPEYVAVAERLTRIVGLTDRVSFRVGGATNLPLEEGSFDVATLIHVGMNVPEKGALCAEAARVLRPGGLFAVYEVMRTGEGDLAYPVAWADTAATSFLTDPAAYRQALKAAGFEVTAEEDRRDPALEFFHRMRARSAESGPPPLGLHLHMGPDAPRKVANMIANLERGVVAPVEMICRRR
jgi:ubiquinone/menaquinone biosynthesis C-methylase UbiE